MYTVEAKKGGQRNTTLRDARTMNLVPSVTTILNIAAKPALLAWMQQQVLYAALTLPRRPDEPISERAFAHEAGFGGKCDLYSESDGGFVADIKTKEFTDPDKIGGYDEHLMQLAAYRVGLGVPTARCANVFVSRNVPGLVVVKEWPLEDLTTGWEMFMHLLAFWQLKNDHK